jgi:murein DD-endopeptidase MepM/ murein hydrolase activator NlpD
MPIVTRAPVLLVLLVLLVATPAGVPAPPAAAGTAVPVGVWPLRPSPEVVRGFDPPDERWGAGHRGVDLLGSPGVAVRAGLPGVVSFAGRIAGRGVVVVDHGATRTTYEPVLAAVRRGRRVAAGAVLGHLAPDGSHCPPRACLHWGWLRGETYLDPLLLVGAGPVRLLPLAAAAPLASPASWTRWRTWAPSQEPAMTSSRTLATSVSAPLAALTSVGALAEAAFAAEGTVIDSDGITPGGRLRPRRDWLHGHRAWTRWVARG